MGFIKVEIANEVRVSTPKGMILGSPVWIPWGFKYEIVMRSSSVFLLLHHKHSCFFSFKDFRWSGGVLCQVLSPTCLVGG